MTTERVRYHARWVVPVAAPPLNNGTVVVRGERIAWVGPRALAPAADRDEDLGDCILTPGLVNTHTHLDLTVMRGFLEDLPFFDWVRTLTQARAAVIAPADALDSALLGVAEGLRAGITTFADTADSDASFAAMLTLGARGIAYREVFGPDPAAAREALDGLKSHVAAMRAHATPLVRVGVSPHAPYSVSDALFRAVAAFAEAEGLPVAVHVAESAAERALVQSGDGPFADFLRSRGIDVAPRAPTPIALMRAVGLARPGTLLIHCVHASDEDIRAVAHAGCGVAHCPASNAKLGHGVAPLAELLAAGVRVGLGSDSMASNNQMELLTEARLAVFQQRSRLRDARALSAHAALRLATLGGAEALRLDAEIGSIEPGKQADFVAFAARGYAPADLEVAAQFVPRGPAIPGGAACSESDPVTTLVFAPHSLRVNRVLVAGVERVRDGAVAGFDPAIPNRVSTTAKRLSQWRHERTAR